MTPRFFTGKFYRYVADLFFVFIVAEYVFLLVGFSTFFYVILFKYSIMFTEQRSSQNPKVGALTLHVPSFKPSDTQLWLTLFELEFKNYRMTSGIIRFRWVAVRLPLDLTFQVRNVIMSSCSYKVLKTLLYLGLPLLGINAWDICFIGFSSVTGILES